MAWTRRVDSISHLCKTSTAALIIISLTERVPFTKRLGREADGVNSEWIYISAPPIHRHEVHRDTFNLYIYRLLQTYEKQLMVFMGKMQFILRILRDINIDDLNVRAGGASCK